MTRARQCDEGFALPAVLFVMILLFAIGVASLNTTGDERAAGRALRESAKAFYAAEAGANAVLAAWDQAAYDTILPNPGDSLDLGWQTLENGCTYRAVVRRVDGGDLTRIYYITSTGRGVGGLRGQRTLGAVIGTFEVILNRALMVGGNLVIDGSPSVLGECPGAHANGSIGGGGSPTIDGDVSATDTVTLGSGDIQDSEGNPVEPTSYADSIDLPKLNPLDYCGDADKILRDGWLVFPGPPADSTALPSASDGGAPVSGWKYDAAKDLYSGTSSVEAGTYCVEGNVQMSGSPGTKDSPLLLSLLITGSADISGKPFLKADHPDGIAIMTGGDLEISGSSDIDTALDGLVYAGSQCDIGGRTVITGQLACYGDPDPPGAIDLVSENKIHGNATVSFNCSSLLVKRLAKPLRPGGWYQLMN